MAIELELEEARGGDMFLRAGKGWAKEKQRSVDGSIIFQDPDENELMRFDPDGSISVRGVLVESDTETVAGFKQWLEHATVEHTTKGQEDGGEKEG